MKAEGVRVPAAAVPSSLCLPLSMPGTLPVSLSQRLLRHRHRHWKLEGRQGLLLVMVICHRGVHFHGSCLGRPCWRLPGNWMLGVVVHGGGSEDRRAAACTVVLMA